MTSDEYVPLREAATRLDMVTPAQLWLPDITTVRPAKRFDCIARLGTLEAAHEFYPTLHDYWIQRLSSAERSA